ncbi:MAG: hypothetical protein ACRC1M_01725 [Methanobacteriaceae archaeon]
MDNFNNKTNNANNNNNKSNIKENNIIISEISSKINDILDRYNSNVDIVAINSINAMTNNSAIINNTNPNNNSNNNINNNNCDCDIETNNISSKNPNNNSNNSCDIDLDSSGITKAFQINEIKEFSFLNTSYCRGNIRIYNININNNSDGKGINNNNTHNNDDDLKKILSNIENELASIFSNYGDFEVKSEYYCPCCILPYYRIKFSVDISNV